LLGGKKDMHVPMAFLMCICGGMVGVFILRPITRIPEIFIYWDVIRHLPIDVVIASLFGEMVFYGGMIGCAVTLIFYCRGYKLPLLPYADLFAPGLALAHGFGRIGCFLGGCCYGVNVDASHPFAVVFPDTGLEAVPHGVPLLATQLIEAACLFVIAAILSVIYKKTTLKGLTLCMYGVLYSILRFVLEYFRGDLIRGVYGPFSTSQYISIAIFIISATLLCILLKNMHKKSVTLDNTDKME